MRARMLLFFVGLWLGLGSWAGCYFDGRRCNPLDPFFDLICDCVKDTDCPAPQVCIAQRCTTGSSQNELSPSTETSSEPRHDAKSEPSPPIETPLSEPTNPEEKAVTPDGGPLETGVCTVGESRACYTGTSGTVGHGECRNGIQRCESGMWSTRCEGEVTPKAESCDSKDNDCNGQIDENLSRPCYFGPPGTENKGECRAGKTTCRNGIWGPCEGEIEPTPEICNGKDDNCDGKVDEGCDCIVGQTQACGSAVGSCKPGQQTCSNSGKWGPCQGAMGPAKEVCDGQDNDCNGKVDDNISGVGGDCTVPGARGVCTKGQTICQNGSLTCIPLQQSSTEVCDGLDNDCDGRVDESDARLGTDCKALGQIGKCEEGAYQCTNGQLVCTPKNSSLEVCDGQDNDCNGQIDEIFSCIQGERTCASNGTTILRCNDSCTQRTSLGNCSISLSSYCNAGYCQTCNCDIGRFRCNGGRTEIEQCGFDGNTCDWHTDTTCTAGTICTQIASNSFECK